jgi:type III pantothenate kinase
MLLAVDIGNSQIKLGVHDGQRWRARWRIRSAPEMTSEEYAVLIQSLINAEGGGLKPERVALASVVPALTEVFREVAETALGCPVLVVGPGVRTGLSIRTDHPSEVGADLAANAVAAHARFGARCIAVDFGTATSFVAVDEPPTLVGVVIAPGVRTSADGLSERAAQLPRLPLAAPPEVLGKNTVHAMQSGVVLGHARLVDGLIGLIRGELGPAPVVATGHWAELIVPRCREIEALDPCLTLEGIRLIAVRNA